MSRTQGRDVLPELTWTILRSALKVHRELGPGLLESTYRTCLLHQLREDGLDAEAEVAIPVEYRGIRLDSSYRADLIVGGAVLVELKAVEGILPIHCQQTLTYLKLSRMPIALLVNFNVARLRSGIRRFVNPRWAQHG